MDPDTSPSDRLDRLDRRRVLALSGVSLAALAGCAGGDDDDDAAEETPEDTPTDTPDEESEADDTADEQDDEQDDDDADEDEAPERSDADTLMDIRETLGSDDPLFSAGGEETFSGESASVTDEFSLVPALAVFAFEHDGESNFIAELEGPVEELVVNTIGETTGAACVAADRGDYLLDVDADGEWSLTVGQPIAPPEEIRTPGVTAEGEGPAVVGPVELDAATTFSGQHESDEGNFIVQVFNEEASDGFADELVFNEIGAFDGETRVDPAGVAWIDVEAEGAWRLEIE